MKCIFAGLCYAFSCLAFAQDFYYQPIPVGCATSDYNNTFALPFEATSQILWYKNIDDANNHVNQIAPISNASSPSFLELGVFPDVEHIYSFVVSVTPVGGAENFYTVAVPVVDLGEIQWLKTPDAFVCASTSTNIELQSSRNDGYFSIWNQTQDSSWQAPIDILYMTSLVEGVYQIDYVVPHVSGCVLKTNQAFELEVKENERIPEMNFAVKEFEKSDYLQGYNLIEGSASFYSNSFLGSFGGNGVVDDKFFPATVDNSISEFTTINYKENGGGQCPTYAEVEVRVKSETNNNNLIKLGNENLTFCGSESSATYQTQLKGYHINRYRQGSKKFDEGVYQILHYDSLKMDGYSTVVAPSIQQTSGQNLNKLDGSSFYYRDIDLSFDLNADFVDFSKDYLTVAVYFHREYYNFRDYPWPHRKLSYQNHVFYDSPDSLVLKIPLLATEVSCFEALKNGFCLDSTIQLFDEILSGEGTERFSILGEENLVIENQIVKNIPPAGRYLLDYSKGITVCTQQFFDTIILKKPEKINLSILDKLCVGDSSRIQIQEPLDGYNVNWLVDNEQLGEGRSIVYIPTLYGETQLTIDAFKENECPINQKYKMHAGENPNVSFDYKGGIAGQPTQFVPLVYNSSDTAELYRWKVSNLFDIYTQNLIYTFMNSGVFPQELEVTNTSGCSTSYIQNLPIYDMVGDVGTIDMGEFYAKDGSVKFVSNNESWFVSGNNSTAWLQSPVVNLNDFENPFMSMVIDYKIEDGVDGAYMLYSEVNPNVLQSETEWKVLYAEEDLRSWYNQKGVWSIPEYVNPSKSAWSGNSVSSHAINLPLENLRDSLSSNGLVQFRWVYNSNAFNPAGFGEDYFKLLGVQIHERNKLVLVEHFNSFKDESFNCLINYVEDGFGNDGQIEARKLFYNQDTTIKVNGQSYKTEASGLLDIAPFDLTMFVNKYEGDYRFVVSLTNGVDSLVQKDLGLYLIVNKKKVIAGDSILDHVFHAFGFKPIEFGRYHYVFDLWDIIDVREMTDTLEVFAFVQNKQTKEVLQCSNIIFIKDVLEGNSTKVDGLPDDILLYPNPSSGWVNVCDELLGERYVLRTATGQVIREDMFTSRKIDMTQFEEGLYFFQIDGGAVVKLVLMK